MSLKSFLSNLFPKRQKSEDEKLPISMVLLLKNSHFFHESELRAAAEKAWRTSFAGEETSKNFVVQKGVVTFLKVGPHILSLLHAEKPYLTLTSRELAKFLPDKERQGAWRAHNAWCAVDYISSDQDLELAYCVLAKLVAEMLDTNCVGVYVPVQRSLIPNGESLYSELQKIAASREHGVVRG